ncbi:hepatic sodium/bile acid cotransporter [Stomoxys calcitrans]|uniref:hepatic sodium/bile acid cotransporter n=1 Tax=Stomoxys calcitrans TaxID=35570 RepID=UPI0027E33ED7|nr:hepatic sodium/bile acid cotransporter [Stomoxys calcitrans]
MKVKTSKSASANRLTTPCITLLLVITIIGKFNLAQADDYGSLLGAWRVNYGHNENFKELRMWTSDRETVPLVIYNITQTNNMDLYFEIHMENPKIAQASKLINITEVQDGTWQGDIQVEGIHFGLTKLYATLYDPRSGGKERGPDTLEVMVKRSKSVSDETFTYTAASIALLMFVNLGTVLDLKRVVTIFSRPIGPLVGFCARYIIMPALAIGLGALMLRDDKGLQLALFFTALAPSGGIANICNVFLKGNLNLSLATTTVNSILVLGMLPMWVYLVGPALYETQEFDLPFVDLIVSCVGLCMALIVGVLLRMFIPKTTRFIFRFLKPLSIILSLCLVGLTVGINYFVFQKMTFMIFLCCFCLPVLGYGLSFALSKLLCRTATDSMTISIETSVLNMTMPIVLLKNTMDQPMADMLIVVPITAALVSLCLVVAFYIVRRILGWNTTNDSECFDEKAFLIED